MGTYPSEIMLARSGGDTSIALIPRDVETGCMQSPATRRAAENPSPDTMSASTRGKGHAALALTEERSCNAHLVATILGTLEWNRLIPHNTIHVEACEGYVTLTGRVYTFRDREEAGMLAKRVPGVRGIDNRIEILTDDIVSGRLKSVVDDVLLRHTKCVCDGIGVGMKSGRVVLTGKVRSVAEKQLVLDAVRWARHVDAIEDRLEVVPDRP